MNRSDDDFAREVQSHLELESDRLVAEGMAPDAARQAARRRFGNPTRAAERFYESRRLRWWDHLKGDARAALRTIVRTPIASTVAILSLAGGIGATTVTLTVRNLIFYNPPPLYQQPDQLSLVSVSTPERPRRSVAGRVFTQWASDPDLRSTIAAAGPGRTAAIRGGERTESVGIRAVTPNLFPVLGVQPALGRAFSSSRDAASGPPPVLLSQSLWHRMFEARTDVLGTVVWIDERPYTVIGVMPARFWFGSTTAEVWTPLAESAIGLQAALDVVVRRPRALTSAALGERLQRDITADLASEGSASSRMRVLVSGVGGVPLARQMSVAVPWFVGIAVLLTLLIACANVALLMFARWTARERELAVRSCLGASRGRALALLLTESSVLAIAGGLLGVCATFALRGLFVRNASAAANYDVFIDYGVLGQATIVTLVAGIVSGIAPAFCETRRLQMTPLRLMASSERARQRWRHTLVVLEVAVTVALLVVAAGQLDASRRMLTADMGFAEESLVVARIENPVGVDVGRVLEAVRHSPGVAAAAIGSGGPPGGAGPVETISSPSSRAVVSAERVSVGTDYFAALGVPVRAGRTITEADVAAAAPVVVVTETLARHLWPDGHALSSRVMVQHTAYEVIGIVGAYATGPLRAPTPRLYVPVTSGAKPPARVDIFVRAEGEPGAIIPPLRQQIRALGATYAMPSAFALTDVLKVGAAEIRVLAVVMSPLLGIGMFLTASGIFGVLAFAIARRANELALRLALGATGGSVARLVARHTITLLGTGAIAGVAGTYALTRIVGAAGGGGSSFGTPGWPAFAIPVAIIFLVGALATWIPTRRAIRVDPARLLRAE